VDPQRKLTCAIFKEHSNYQRKYFSESSESMDVSKSHAKCNVAHFSRSKVTI